MKLVAGFSKTQERLEVEEFLCRDRFQLQVMPQTKPISTLTEVCLVFVSNKKLLNMFFFQSLQLSKTWYLDVFDFCLALKASPLGYQPSTLKECFVPRYPPSQETGRVNISQSCSGVMMYSMICIM